jgi:outer membrane receptor protein involved in Fe transport
MDAEGLNATYHGFRSRLSLAWHPDTDSMLYTTWSQGFRPGAFNRSSPKGEAPYLSGKANKDLIPTGYQYKRPLSYSPDQLTNIEAGYKASLLNHRIQLDATAYHMTWKNVQFLFFNPAQFSNTSFVTNGPDYTTNGVELQLSGKATRELTLQGSASYNRAKESASPCLTSNQPTSQTFGQCITQIKGKAVANLYGNVGDPPAFSPKIQFSLRARYDWAIDTYKAFFSVGANHVGGMSNQPSNYPSGNDAAQIPVPTTTLLRYDMPGYTLYDAAFGISKDNWRVQINGSNLGNSNASTFTNSTQFLKQEVPVRPRVLGLTIGMSF